MLLKILNKSNLLALWCDHKYGSLWCNSSSQQSHLWRELKKSAQRIRNKLLFNIGIGSNLSLFFDPWCAGYSLFEQLGPKCFAIFNKTSIAKLSSILLNEALRARLGSLEWKAILNLHLPPFLSINEARRDDDVFCTASNFGLPVSIAARAPLCN